MEPRSRTFMTVDNRPNDEYERVVATSYYTRFISPGYRYAAICFKSHHYDESRPLPRWPLTRLTSRGTKGGPRVSRRKTAKRGPGSRPEPEPETWDDDDECHGPFSRHRCFMPDT
ncbi:unnamed protein product [Lasius platythorax]|uniref:Uncharacterized protein n=1 Tax=Lasius platythorax TaxID=488582 RepID=A0AAV2P163_9HYME